MSDVAYPRLSGKSILAATVVDFGGHRDDVQLIINLDNGETLRVVGFNSFTIENTLPSKMIIPE